MTRSSAGGLTRAGPTAARSAAPTAKPLRTPSAPPAAPPTHSRSRTPTSRPRLASPRPLGPRLGRGCKPEHRDQRHRHHQPRKRAPGARLRRDHRARSRPADRPPRQRRRRLSHLHGSGALDGRDIRPERVERTRVGRGRGDSQPRHPHPASGCADSQHGQQRLCQRLRRRDHQPDRGHADDPRQHALPQRCHRLRQRLGRRDPQQRHAQRAQLDPGAQLGRNRNRQHPAAPSTTTSAARRSTTRRSPPTKPHPKRRGQHPSHRGTSSCAPTIVADPIGGANCAGPGHFTTQGYNLSDTTGCGLLSGGPQLRPDR